MSKGHLGDYDLFEIAGKEYSIYLEKMDDRYLSKKMYDSLYEVSRRWCLQTMGDMDYENLLELCHEVSSDIIRKLQKRKIDPSSIGYYFRQVWRSKRADFFRKQQPRKRKIEFVGIDDVEEKDYFHIFGSTSDYDPLAETALMDGVQIVIQFVRSRLYGMLFTRGRANELALPVMIAVIRGDSTLFDEYDFRTRVVLRKVIFETELVYREEILNL